MYHTMYTGMDAIDYEPDASLIDGDDYYDYDDYGGSDGNNDSDEIDDWDGNSGDSDFSDDSDAASTRFPPHNLRNPKSFPSYNECSPFELYDVRDDDNEPIPPPRHWCYLGEIVESMSYPVPVLLVKGKDDKHTVITVHFDLEAHFDVKVGSTIAVLYAEKKKGLLLEYPKFVTILPCNLETLLRINDDIESETSGGSVRKCKGCGKEEGDETTLLRCSRCLSAFYCGKECQTAAWKREHKRECKVFQAVIELKRSRDWGNKDPSEWVAFGEREELRPDTPADPSHLFRPEWKEARPAVVQEVQGTFTISSARRTPLGPIDVDP
ncbi:hypothetical protein B0H11DRAFT_324706 [Mycena galericulata]|nr:hypothetical protein B0H11DRAFT_324706 [Mycena galericulata]